jgi:putative flippase GtrA
VRLTRINFKLLPQFVRYLMVGGFNTLFSYGAFALLTWLFRGMGKYSYMLAALVANVLAITVAYLGYKWFVFQTKGNYLVEWLRCFGVYGGNALLGLAALPIVTEMLRHHLTRPGRAPYLAAALLAGLGVMVSFVGHKSVTFRPKTEDTANTAAPDS